MEKNAGDRVSYFLQVSHEYKHELARIRHWSNLKAASEGSAFWVKDLDYAQVHSPEVQSIPFKHAFYQQENRLFPLHSRLPERTVPTLLWTPIDRALLVKLPSLNHNYFGIEEQLSIKLTASGSETDATAMITTQNLLAKYVAEAPAVRLESIRWALLDADRVFLLGIPMLPLPGDSFWARKDLLLPTGLDFELPVLTDAIQKKISPGRDQWVVWHRDETYSLIPKEAVMPLSRSSFRLTTQQPEHRLG
jgi:hypothetical protein